jgi:uncharacterized protein YdhG (YjbR/CyaY superfamily)
MERIGRRQGAPGRIPRERPGRFHPDGDSSRRCDTLPTVTGPTTIEEYLAGLPGPERETLERLRATIRSMVPEATETISYQMPAFKLHGRFLVSYAAFRDHCSLFPANDRVREAMGDALAPYLSGKGTLQFTVDEPIPADLVERVVGIRVQETLELERVRRARGR